MHMRQTQTAVLERYTVLEGEFSTEPYEAGWAAEARWFIQVLESSNDGELLDVTTQISPDGLNWCDAGNGEHAHTGTGLLSFPAREFGQWLRLRGSVRGTAKVLIYLTLKS